MASHYGRGDGFAGRRTASGERMDPQMMTCAHKRHRMGTILEVTDVKTGKKVLVRVNDRGPFVHGRVVDLSYGAFRRLSSRGGLVNVRVRPVGYAAKHRDFKAKVHKMSVKAPQKSKPIASPVRPRALQLIPDDGFYSRPPLTPGNSAS